MVNVPNSVRAGNNIERSVVTVQVGGRSVAQRGDAAAACKGEVSRVLVQVLGVAARLTCVRNCADCCQSDRWVQVPLLQPTRICGVRDNFFVEALPLAKKLDPLWRISERLYNLQRRGIRCGKT